ncbi:MAG: zf-HC2 domain-containing protein, partial [Gemmatimonadota bacterium]
MTHAEYGTLLSFVDGELNETEVSALESHLAACAGCREEFEDVRLLSDEVSQALGLISAVPSIADARARLDARVADARQPARLAMPWHFATAGLLKAAAVVLLVAGAASAAIPGSPVRRWAEALFDRVSGGPAPEAVQPEVVTPTEPDEPAQEPSVATVPMILRADAGRLRVSVHTVDPAATVTVRVVDGEGQIRPATEGKRYRSGEGHVDVYDISKSVLIEIPRSLPGATVEVDGRLIWRKEGASVRAYEPA